MLPSPKLFQTERTRWLAHLPSFCELVLREANGILNFCPGWGTPIQDGKSETWIMIHDHDQEHGLGARRGHVQVHVCIPHVQVVSKYVLGGFDWRGLRLATVLTAVYEY